MNYFEYFNAFLAGGRDKTRRKVKGNTYAERLANGNIGLRFHATMVCEYWPNGNVTLRSGGYQTVTTQDRINNNSPVRVYSNKGSWAIWHGSDQKTAPKVQKCRVCKGTGNRSWTCYGARDWGYVDGFYQKLDAIEPCAHGLTESHGPVVDKGGCYRCDGKGTRDYGSKAIPTPFYDGIVVDMDGKVISVSGTTILANLTAAIPGLASAQVKACPQCGGYRYTLVPNIIMHLNDNHLWSRSQIADWLETLDVDLSFSVAN